MDNSSNWSITLQTALEKIQQHDLSAGLEIILELVGEEPQNITLINLLADCYYYLGEFDRAKACWEEVLRLNPANQEAKNKIGRYKTPSFQSWIKRYKHALYNIEQKNYETALKSLRELLEENDGFVSVYQFLGLCYMACSEYDQAVIVWKKGLQRDTGNQTLSDYLRMIPELGKQSTPATDADVPKAGKDMGARQYPWRNAALAVTATICLLLLFKAGVNPTPVDKAEPRAILKSEALMVADNEAQAEIAAEDTEVLSDSLLMEEDSRGGADYDLDREKDYYLVGYRAYQDGQFQTAKSNLSIVASMNTGNYINREGLYYLARTCYLQKNYQEAEQYYLQYLKQFPNSNYCDDSLFYLGVIYNATGQTEKAVKALEEMQRISPNCGYESSDIFKTIMKGK